MKEIIEKDVEVEEKQNSRTGETSVTSVSVSKKFQDLIDEYKLSPTEIYRRGVAVTLHDMGIKQYVSEVNKERSDYVKKFLEAMDKDEKMREEYDKMQIFAKIKSSFNEIKELIKRIENE